MAERATRPSTAHSARMYMTANAALISVLNSGKRHTCNNTVAHYVGKQWRKTKGLRHARCKCSSAECTGNWEPFTVLAVN
jgi:hypothetical protein